MSVILPDQQEAQSQDRSHHVLLVVYKCRCPHQGTKLAALLFLVMVNDFQNNHPMIKYVDYDSVTEEGKYPQNQILMDIFLPQILHFKMMLIIVFNGQPKTRWASTPRKRLRCLLPSHRTHLYYLQLSSTVRQYIELTQPSY